jgi:hypothetical protein
MQDDKTMKPNERWARLTGATATCMNAGDEDAFEAGRCAIWLGRAFSDYIGTPEQGRVLFYALESTAGPTQQFRPVYTGWAAVSRASDAWWQFGLGVELERAPGVYPRLVVCWPTRLRLQPWLNIQIGRRKPVELRPDRDGYIDFDPVCETMFQLVTSTLQQVSRGHEPPEDMVLFAGD